jgi:hypothetical protein
MSQQALKQVASAPSAPLVRIRAYQTGDNAWLDLRWIKVVVTDELVARLHELSTLVTTHGLSEVRVRIGPEQWGPEGIEDQATLENDELVVTVDAFWFTADIKHDDSSWCESEFLSISRFLAAVAGGETTFGDIKDDDDQDAGEGE